MKFEFQNWTLIQQAEEPDRQYDHLWGMLTVAGVPEGYNWAMLVQAGRHFDKWPLKAVEGGVGIPLTKDMLSVDGRYNMQLEAVSQSDGETVRHSNVIQVFVPCSLSGDARWPSLPWEFLKAEERMRELNSHPPVPGDSGYWMIWDLDSHSYVGTEFPLPKVDSTLTKQGAAADANAVGTAAVLLRKSLTSNDDMDRIVKAGHYFKDKTIAVANGVNSNRARILCLQKESSEWGIVQLWMDTDSNRMYLRVKTAPGASWSGWKEMASAEDAAAAADITRGLLTSNDDMDRIVKAGHYFKDKTIAVANGVNSNRARILCLQKESSEWGIVQLWMDTDSNRMYLRVKTAPSVSWSGWKEMASAEDAAAAADLTRGPLTPNDDMDRIVKAGHYFKDKTIAVANGVNSNRARVLCLQNANSEWGVTQLWMDTDSNRMYLRAKTAPGASWSAWKEMADTEENLNILPVTDNLPNTAEQVYALWDSLVDGEMVTKTVLGTVDGYEYPLYRVDFAPEGLASNYTVSAADALFKRKKVLIVASVHGDEPVPVAAVYEFFKHAISNPGFANVKEYIFDIIPVGNPWGFSHSVVDSDGKVQSGFYNYVAAILPEGYSVKPHTEEWRGNGIRYNALGYDINRDFCDYESSMKYPKDRYNVGGSDVDITYGFKTQEAAMIRDLMKNGYEFVVDYHMGGGTGDVTSKSDICAFANLNAQPVRMSDAEYAALKNSVLSKVQKCHVNLDLDLNRKYNVTGRNQGFYTWGSLNAGVGDIPNWFTGTKVNTGQGNFLVKFALTLELSLWCYKYSGSTTRNNKTTNLVGVNYIGRMLDEICGMM